MVADFLHAVDRIAELADPVVLVLSYQADAPGQGLASAAGDTAVDQGVEDLAFLESEPCHCRRVHGGEMHLGAAAHRPPAHLAPEESFRVVGDGHALFPRGFSERDDLLFGAEAGAGRTEVSGDEDLVGIVADLRGVGEPAVGQRLGEPGGEGRGVGGRRSSGPLTAGSGGRRWIHGNTGHSSKL